MTSTFSAPAAQHAPADLFPLAEDVHGLYVWIVNVYFLGTRDNWVLVDAGLPFAAGKILNAAHSLFGNAKPSAIIMTHGHFDHIGSLRKLADHWDVPIFAHPMELPYLTGEAKYPPPDPTVGGGMMALTSYLLPRGPIDVSDRVRPLPDDFSVPFMPDWKWIYTPGHSPGHVSFFREADRTLIAGDAFVTTKQESLLSAIMKPKHLQGPPAYFTHDWQQARDSIIQLLGIRPLVAGTGHGQPMAGEELIDHLTQLAEHFDEDFVPARGIYIDDPATFDLSGPRHVPQRAEVINKAAQIGTVALAAMIAYKLLKPSRG